MSYRIYKPDFLAEKEIELPISKSLSNRIILISQLSGNKNRMGGVSKAQDTIVLQEALQSFNHESGEVYDVKHAGTAMRFLTAFFAMQDGIQILTGSQRLKQRPIGVLVDALIKLGANIDYLEREGHPPLKIGKGHLTGGELDIQGDISSQFISALLLIGPYLERGLRLNFIGTVVSRPYIDMTINTMRQFGAEVTWKGSTVHIKNKDYVIKEYNVEADWTSASYWYQVVAFSKQAKLKLLNLQKDSIQGDRVVKDIYEHFNVKTEFGEDGITIEKEGSTNNRSFKYDFLECPDLAQTLAVTCAGLGITAQLNGLNTLKIKETDRIEALKVELEKLGLKCTSSEESLKIGNQLSNNPISVCTYTDHRMAMSFAPLAMVLDYITLDDLEVVKKSYPTFWEHMEKVGFKVQK